MSFEENLVKELNNLWSNNFRITESATDSLFEIEMEIEQSVSFSYDKKKQWVRTGYSFSNKNEISDIIKTVNEIINYLIGREDLVDTLENGKRFYRYRKIS